MVFMTLHLRRGWGGTDSRKGRGGNDGGKEGFNYVGLCCFSISFLNGRSLEYIISYRMTVDKFKILVPFIFTLYNLH